MGDTMETKYKVVNRCPIGAIIRKDYVDIFGFVLKTEHIKVLLESWFVYNAFFNDSIFSYSTIKERLYRNGFKERYVIVENGKMAKAIYDIEV